MKLVNAHPDTLETAGQWIKQAACRTKGVEPETFFPDNNADGIEQARSICRACPVRLLCLEDCLRAEGGKGAHARHGVFAGLTPRQRVREAERRRDRAKKSTPPQSKPEPNKPAPKEREPVKCGTRGGYRLHRKNGEDACDACRQANTDADNRLRRTGTTKAAA